ncbi:MAG TPA: hypothetical protein VF742_02735, partial [Terracidiphilus sp.]
SRRGMRFLGLAVEGQADTREPRGALSGGFTPGEFSQPHFEQDRSRHSSAGIIEDRLSWSGV